MSATVAVVASPSVFNLADNDFVLFGLPERFALDVSALDSQWKALQRELHPDKFAAQGPAAQRLAMQWSARINEAYARLKKPVQRAAYLCELRGAVLALENNTAMPADFLQLQMQWREALEDANCLEDLQNLEQAVLTYKQHWLDQCAQALDDTFHLQAALDAVRRLMFLEKLETSIDHARCAFGFQSPSL